MPQGQTFPTILIAVVLFCSRLTVNDSQRTREKGERDHKHSWDLHHENMKSGVALEQDGAETLNLRASKQDMERNYSGNDLTRQINSRHIYYRAQKHHHRREALDDKNVNHLYSGEKSRTSSHDLPDQENSAWDHFEMHLHSHGINENEGEFGYLAEDKEMNVSQDNDNDLSGEVEHNHKHEKTSHVHRRLLPKETYSNVKEDVHLNSRHTHLTSGSHVDEKWIDQEVDGEANEGGGFWNDDEEGTKHRRDVEWMEQGNGKEDNGDEVKGTLKGKKETTSRLQEVNGLRRDLIQRFKKSGYLSNDQDSEDLYIADNDELKEKLHTVEMGSAADRKEIGEGGKEDKQEENNERFRRGISRHLLQFDTKEPVSSTTECSHPALPGKIPNNSMIYNRNECRLCQCIMGELICEPKPELCYQRYWLGKHLCHMVEGEALRDGERHFDGCNNCLCRNGELLCTRIRCPSADNNYTNYGEAIASKTLNNSTKSETNDVRKRGKDPCMECDYEPILPVCGLNWITYRSMCHAIHCGGHNMEQVYQGPCKHKNPCDDAKCAEHEICLNRKQGPCLASTTTDGEVVECQQHQCVNPSQDCTSVSEGKVCGENHQTYTSECAMSAQGVALAYNGSCEEECADDYSQMCGMDGVTLASSCAAAFLYSHIDYPGACDDVDPQTSVITSSRETYYNRRCKIVEEYVRCPPLECESQVIPEGSCCPTCGTAISMRLDTAVKDMTTIKTSIFYHLNRLGFIYSTLKTLQNEFGGSTSCQITANLLDTNDISVVYKPIGREDENTCKEMARKTVEFINSPTKNDTDPGLAALAAAVFIDYSERTIGPRAESSMTQLTKRRKKRHSHHDHHTFFDKNERIRPQTILIFSLVVVAFLLYKYC